MSRPRGVLPPGKVRGNRRPEPPDEEEWFDFEEPPDEPARDPPDSE